MPSASVALSTAPQSFPATKPTKQAVPRLAKRIKQALDIMVWDNKTDNEAAKLVGFSVMYLRVELRKSHVRAYYRGQLEVLRERESSRNIHTLVAVRDQTKNQMARVQAVKALEQIDDSEQASRGSQSLPGLQIVIVQGVASDPQRHAIDVTASRSNTQLDGQ